MALTLDQYSNRDEIIKQIREQAIDLNSKEQKWEEFKIYSLAQDILLLLDFIEHDQKTIEKFLKAREEMNNG